MPIACTAAHDTIRFETRGDVDFAEGLEVLRQGLGETKKPSGDPRGWHLLFDIQFSTERRTAGEMERIVEVIARHRATLSGRCAIVTANPLHFGLARMVGAMLERAGLGTHVCGDPEKANRWLQAGRGS